MRAAAAKLEALQARKDATFNDRDEIDMDTDDEEEDKQLPLEEVDTPVTPTKKGSKASADDETPKQKKEKKQIPIWPRREWNRRIFGVSKNYKKLLDDHKAFWDTKPKSVLAAAATRKKKGVSSAHSHSPSR